jgi:peptidoglycan/LPS O-acetylase OafA/YrhL
MSASATDGFRPDLEGLRGVAILLVVACHCGVPWCAGGFIGVDVFFVLSGFLITGLLAQEHLTPSGIDLPGFFARRVRRLLPAALLFFVLTVWAAVALLAPQEIAMAARSAIAAACYVSNLWFDRTAADYFAPSVATNPFLHTWSLAVEEQFYLLWPWLILATRPGTQRIVVLSALAAVSFACAVLTTNFDPTFAFYELPARAWEFAAGGLLAILPMSKTSTPARAVVAGVAGICLILGTAAALRGGAGFPGWSALLPVAGTLAVLYSCTQAQGRGVSSMLGAAPLRFLGLRSYSWYLWHWPFVVYTGVVLPDVTVGGRVLAGAAALLAAAVTFRYVEGPMRRLPVLAGRARMWLGMAGVATVGIVSGSYAVIGRADEQIALDSDFQKIGNAAADVGNIPKGCWSEGKSYEAKICEFGNANATRSIALLGDSHAMQWVGPMRTATSRQGWRLIISMRLGCGASEINPYGLSKEANRCAGWRSQAIEKIISMRPTAVVISSYNGWSFRGDGVAWSNTITLEEVREGTRHTLAEFARAGIPVVVLRDTPLPPFDIPACLARHVTGGLAAQEQCDFDATVALNATAFAAEHRAADGLPNIYFLDMNDLICPGIRCQAIREHWIVYRDKDHLTGAFAQSLAPMLEARLFQLPFTQSLAAR